jgi:hypothetical protein
MSTKEEPSYMMFARANVKDNQLTTPLVVKALLERIDRLEKTVADVKALTDKAYEGHTYVLPDGYPSRPVEASELRNALEEAKK